jgi:outer membrane lipase/esterase
MRLISKLLCSAVLVSASMAASAYSSLVVFGDSLSDSGNNEAIFTSLGIGTLGDSQIITGNSYIPELTYASGVYSNGPVWASQLASSLGIAGFAPSLLGGTNYAFGGARTYEVAGIYSGLVGQKDEYLAKLAATSSTADATGLYVVAGGGNNVRDTLTAVGAAFMAGNFGSINGIITSAASRFALDIGNIVDSLQGAGAKDIIVWNAPNLGITPAVNASGFGYYGTLISKTFNDVLAGKLASETGVKTFDLFGLAGQAAANGFTNTTDACGAVNPACNTDMSKNLFWDGIHPTTAAHSLIAQNMYVTAVPEPETLVLMVMGIGLIALRTRRRTAELQAA